jgi:hypothetical protein
MSCLSERTNSMKIFQSKVAEADKLNTVCKIITIVSLLLMWYLLKVVLSGLFLIRENGLINPGASHFIVGLFLLNTLLF